MKEWQRTIILIILLIAAIGLVLWSRSASVPTIQP